MRSSKTRIWWVIAALVLLLAGCRRMVFLLVQRLRRRLIARKADVIDLRGEDISAQEAEALAAKYPDKTVLWDVPLSGGSPPEQRGKSEPSLRSRRTTSRSLPAFRI